MNLIKEILKFLALFVSFYVFFNWEDISVAETVEDVCQETSNILAHHVGRGFTDVAYLNCINQGIEVAKQDQEAIISAIENDG